MDDVFDEDCDELLVAEVEWRKLEQDRRKDGFRDGVDQAKDANIQKGFDDGYKAAVILTKTLGNMRGILRSIEYIGNNKTSEPQTSYNITSEIVENSAKLCTEISEFEKTLPTLLTAESVDRSKIEDTISNLNEKVKSFLKHYDLEQLCPG